MDVFIFVDHDKSGHVVDFAVAYSDDVKSAHAMHGAGPGKYDTVIRIARSVYGLAFATPNHETGSWDFFEPAPDSELV